MPTETIPLPPLPDERDAILALPDGRALSYALLGAAEGPALVVLDGPGSRGLARAAAPDAVRLGLRLIAPDRPGFGGSSPTPGRPVTGWAADHAALLDAVGADRAGILTQSGGTPYALAAAAALPGRTIAIGLIGALAPLDDPDALAEAGKQLRSGIRLARRAPWLLRAGLRAGARSVRRDPEKAARKMAADAPPADAEALANPAIWAIHARATVEILSQPDAIAAEIALLARPWGIALDDVKAPTAFWTGASDTTHPPAHAQRLAAMLGSTRVTVVPDAATFGLLPIYADAMRFAAGL